MKIAKQKEIIKYKASLFDLIHGNECKNNKVLSWLRVVKSFLDVEDVYYYYNDNYYFRLMEDSSYTDLPKEITYEKAENLFSDSMLIDFTTSSSKIHPFFDYGFLFKTKEKSPQGILWLKFKEDLLLREDVLQDFWEESCRFLQFFMQMKTIKDDEHRYRELFNVTEMFHSTREVQKLLSHIIVTLERVFPKYVFHLLLSNDYDDYANLPIGNFDFNQAVPKAMKAFVNGSMEVDEGSVLYAPLRGKQGVYGVLEVDSQGGPNFSSQQVEFIRLLAYTAGSALENAKLYEQSRRLITDLQLINETSHQLNMNSKMSETLSLLKKQIKHSFRASVVGFTFLEKDEFEILSTSSPFFFTSEGEKYISFVRNRIQKEKDSIFIGDMMDKLCNGSYRSLMAVPMIQGDTLKGFCIVLHELPYSFSFDMYKLLQSFIHHSTLAITNAMLREKLEKLVITDQMTNLYARHYLDEKMESSLSEDRCGVFLLIDIDDFKSINDSYGHQVGDEVIIQVSNHIKNAVGDKGSVARWGGEELAVYFPNKSIETGKQIAERVVETAPDNSNPKVTLSCGVTSWKLAGDNRETIKELVRRADQALYFAKNNGKNQVVMGN
ncbi:sensor domain-containing diguanylate cyclase [Bacillus seohaeanensis]|jgi:diguanylate cyclase (GGDEF)-like protein|uniref:Diguanylate cyclase domain-containing protein n=1 Tax=Bacillus seohaeanensis TaxID=284580 RepID=A0ABW5RVJ7_9BACI